MPSPRLPRLLGLLPLLALAGPALARDDDDDDDAPVYKPKVEIDFEGLSVGAPAASMPAMRAELSATPGGAQDILFFRDAVARGEVPHPNVFTAEGLFSEHDLPVPGGTCRQLLCPVGAATRAELTVQPEVAWLAQLGFHTGIDAASFRRAPVNLVAVVDKSGSMSGAPLETVKASLAAVVDRLGPQDQLSIVLYGDVSHVWLPPTPMTHRGEALDMIRRIESAGSTAMENGLQVGFGLATSTAPAFDGVTRVMLFTDERPNVGRTDAGSFMGMAEAASRQGVGMTTIGVGEQFGAELATKISSVRGGNLFFFPDVGAMKERFHDEFETMVTELAYDMDLRVTPASGLEITGVYGLPGDAIRWEADGSLRLQVATLFASKEEGGIFFGFSPKAGATRPPTGSVATVSLAYEVAGGQHESSSVALPTVAANDAPLGLTRGRLLVEEATVLKAATALHHNQNDQEGAWRLVHGLRTQLEQDRDPELDDERLLVSRLDETLSRLSGHQGEGSTLRATRDPITGLPALR